MNRKLVLSTLAGAVLVAGIATAQPGRGRGPAAGTPPGGGPGACLDRLDTDEDGKVSAAEWSAHFAELDADGDGMLAAAELPAHRLLGGPGGFGHGPGRGLHHGSPPPEALAHFIGRGGDADRNWVVTAAEWQAAITALDASEDGALQAGELPLRGHGPARPSTISSWDSDGDGALQAAELQALFEAADRNGDGSLSRDDMQALED